MKNNNKRTREWFKQSDYDFATARSMFKSRRYIYTVFVCHLSLEKALKGLYWKFLKKEPPKIHDLIHLLAKIHLRPPSKLKEFIGQLNQMSIVTRYPTSLSELQKLLSRQTTSRILKQTKEVLKWIKKELDKSS